MRHSLYIAATAVVLCPSIRAHADVTISSAPTQDMSCSSGVCVPTATTAVLNVGDLESLLASGNVEVTTTGSGVQADSITVDAALNWSSANTLALDAYDSVAMSKSVSVAGAGGLTLTTNDGGSGGTLSFGPKGHVTFQNLSSSLTINGTTYTLEDSLPTLASAVLANPSGAYALANDYDASQHGTYANCPMDTILNGTIEGLGNAISNLSIHAEHKDSVAAFLGVVGTTGVIENLRLTGVDYVEINWGAPSGLAEDNGGYLFGDEVTGSIVSRPKSAREFRPLVDVPLSRGAQPTPPKFHPYPPAGGLVVNNLDTGTIVSSSTDVRITAAPIESLVGGLVADNVGTISLSSTKGAVSGASAGGLVGWNYGTIDQSYATGSADGEAAGGFASANAQDPGIGTISNSYSTGYVNIDVDVEAGGFIYVQEAGQIESSYSTGFVSTGEGFQSGGFGCGIDGPISSDYWDTTTSGTKYGVCDDENVSGVTGLTTKQLQSGLPAGFDSSIWAEDPKINDGLPYLINNPPEKK